MSGAPVKVLLVESGRSFGGTERVVDTLARKLDRDRFDPWVVVNTSEQIDRWADDLRRLAIPVERRREVTNRFQWNRALGWYRFLRHHRRSLLHLHHVWPSSDRYLVPIAHLAGLSAVVVTDHLAAPPHSRWQRTLKRWEARRADFSVSVSEAVADIMSRSYDLPRESYDVIPNGVMISTPRQENERQETRAAWGVGDEERVWLFVGRLEEQKGVDLLLAAWATLEIPRPNLILIGDGSERAALEEKTEALSLAGSVRFVGEQSDTGPAYRAADALVMPSRFEGMPLVLLEAMSSGLPVVATSVGGIPEATRQGEMAKLIDPGDTQQLADGVREFESDPVRAAELGKRAAVWACQTFGEDRMVKNYQELYQRALDLSHTFPAKSSAESEAA